LPECSEGLAITPIKGAAVLFYSLMPNGSMDFNSRHAGCPPERGIKYAANLFAWNYDIDAVSPILYG